MPTDLATLHSKRCVLRPATLDDLGSLVSAIASPQFPKDLPLAKLYSEDRLVQWLADMCDRTRNGVAMIWSIELHDEARCIGQVSLVRLPNSEAWALAFWLAPTHWGRGLAREAVATVLNHVFRSLALLEVRAGAALWNERSLRALENLGLRAVGETRDGYRIGDVPQAIREFVLTRGEWLRSNAQEEA